MCRIAIPLVPFTVLIKKHEMSLAFPILTIFYIAMFFIVSETFAQLAIATADIKSLLQQVPIMMVHSPRALAYTFRGVERPNVRPDTSL
jgi:hypothetical protein